MSDTPDPKPSVAIEHKTSEWRSPQVMLPIIATISTILVAVIGVIPAILEANKPPALTPTPIIIAIIATSAPANTSVPVAAVSTDVPTHVPTATDVAASVPTTAPTATDIPLTSTPLPTDIPPTTVPTIAPTIAPSETPVPVVEPTAAPNVTLFYDQDSFSILNHSGSRISLEGIVFKGPDASWDIMPFGGLMKALPNNKCLRMRDATVGNRTPPSECGSQMYGFLEIGPKVIFWRGEYFDVVRGDTVLATCKFETGKCGVFVEQQ